VEGIYREIRRSGGRREKRGLNKKTLFSPDLLISL